MKLHLPLSLLAAVVAVFAAQPACAYDIPDQYANAGVEIFAPQDMDDYHNLNRSESYMFQFYASASFNTQTNREWSYGGTLMSGGYCLFTTANGATPVSLSFDGTTRHEWDHEYAYLQNPVFSTSSLIFANLNKLQIENAGTVDNPDYVQGWNYYNSYAGAINTDDFSVTEVNDVVFKNNAHSYTYNLAPDYWEYNTPYTSIYYHTYGGAVDAPTVSLCQNGDITFEGNKLHFDNSRDTENVYTDCYIGLQGGAISSFSSSSSILISDNSGKVSFTGNSVELIQGATCESSYLGAYGGAVYTLDTLELNNNAGGVTFTGNKASASAQSVVSLFVQGGAVYAQNGISINGNADVTFSGNKASASAQSVGHLYVHGGAVYTQNNLSINGNADVTFSGNTASAACTGSSNGGTSVEGGAVHSYYEGLSMDGNGDVTFSGNTASAACTGSSNGGTSVEGGAVHSYYEGLSMDGNGDVTFSGNTASAACTGSSNGGTSVQGGAVYTYYGGLSMDGNGDVTFSGNTASAACTGSSNGDTFVQGGAVYTPYGVLSICNNASVNFADNAIEASFNNSDTSSNFYTQGGAIYSNTYGNLVDISNNGDVSFTGNSIKVSIGDCSTFEYGGSAIYADENLRINNNSAVEFSDNSTEIEYGDYTETSNGSAIYASRNLEIAGNESVVFRNNSGYAIEHKGVTMKLSAKTGGHITFYDSLYSRGTAQLNADYLDANGQLQKATGDIIFSGTPNEDGSYLSESSTMGKTTLHGGTLQVVDNAHLSFGGAFSTIAGSGARVLLRDGYLHGYSSSTSYRAIISSGTSLEVSGHSFASYLTLDTGSSLVVNLDESHLATAALTTGNPTNLGILHINLCVNVEGEEAKGLYKVINLGSSTASIPSSWSQENITVTGSGAAAGATFGDLMWQAGVLYYVASPLWSNHGGSGIWSTDAANWNSGVAYRQGQDVTFTDLGAGEVKLSGALAPGSITVQNTAGNDYAFVAAETSGRLTGSTSLTKAGAGALSLATANDYTGDTEVQEGTLNVQHSTALGASALKMASNTNLNISNGSKVVLAAEGNDILGKVTVDAGASLEMKNSGYRAQTSTVNGTLVFTGQAASVPHQSSTTLSGTGSVVVNDAVVKFSTQSGFTGNVSVQGSDAVLYTGSGAYRGAGTLTVNQGTLRIGYEYGKSGLTLTTGGKVELISNKDAVAELYAQTVSIEKGSVLSVKAAAVAREQEVLQALAAPATAEGGEIAFNPLLAEHATEGADLYVTNLQLKAGSTLALEEAFIDLNGGRLTLAVPGEEKINLTLSGSLDYYSDTQVVLFANAGVVNFFYDGQYMEGTDWSTLAANYFNNEWITTSTTLNYDGETGTVYLEGLCVVPEPTTTTLSLLALAGLCARRRR